jgi:hypothetical protein
VKLIQQLSIVERPGVTMTAETRTTMSDAGFYEIALEDKDVEAAQGAARAAGIDLEIQPKSQIVDPISIILIATGAVATGKFLVDLIDRLQGGIVVDLRPSARHLIRRDHSLPYGWALVIAVDGTLSVNVHDAPKDAAERLISDILHGVLKSASDISDAASKTLGPGKVERN